MNEPQLHPTAPDLESRVLQRLPTAVVVTDDRGSIVYWNAEATRVFGYEAGEVLGRSVAEISVGPLGGPDAGAILGEVMASGRWEGEYDAKRRDGRTVPIRGTWERVRDDEIGFSGVVGASVDISDRRELELDLAFQALHDPLTGLANRRLFLDHLERTLARDVRNGNHTAVFFADLDDFKAVNDRLGHSVGDEVLRAAAYLLSAVIRAGDIAARIGGDEFVVCCHDLKDPSDAYVLADRILKALSAPFRYGGELFSVSASIGIAVAAPGAQADGLLRKADMAMYSAKERGKDRIELFDDELHRQARRRRETAADLRRALRDGELDVVYQPQVALSTGLLVGFEALARWTHPERGPVTPVEFVAVAEACGLIGELGASVLETACSTLSGLLAHSPGRALEMAVNISAHQLADPDFPESVRRAVDLAGVPASHLCLEITESSLVDVEMAARALLHLNSLGIKIAIDDFGTGYSSLSRLRRFPLDYLKIDRAFVSSMITCPADAAIVQALLGLAEALDLRTIAEGVDDVEQLTALTSAGCERAQGFLWSTPVPHGAAFELLDHGPLQLPGAVRGPRLPLIVR